MKTCLFSFEGSISIGAGHAIRSGVIADALVEQGWICQIITSSETCEFIPALNRFKRLDPTHFYEHPISCDLLVIDGYGFDEQYEKHFRLHAKKIMVIDDLANRKHDCDILLDQTYGRKATDYRQLAPEHCKIFTGSDYILLRKEFTELRPMALEKRKKTQEVKRILISMGGSDPKNYTLKALEMIKRSEFTGSIDIILGFSDQNAYLIKEYIATMPNEYAIHINPNMSKLIYDADLAIGAAGSSVWERCSLGLPTIMVVLSPDQELIAKNLEESGAALLIKDIENTERSCGPELINNLIKNKDGLRSLQKNAAEICDGNGVKLVLEGIHELY